MTTCIQAVITNIASYVPARVLSNQELENMVDTSDEWIVARTGIRERRIASEEEFSSTMGAKAATQVLLKADCPAADIEAIIVATMTPDFLCPSTAALIQHDIKATRAAAFDISVACSGFVYGLSIAKAFIEAGMYRKVLLIASEKNSSFVNYSDRNTCILFGDGASACLIQAGGKGFRIHTTLLGASGADADLVKIPAGGCRLPSSSTSHAENLHRIHMNGKELFKHAVRRMEESINECLKAANVSPSEVRWFVPHQANIRIIEAVCKRFAIPSEQVAVTIETLANTSAASIPLTLDHLCSRDAVQPGDKLLLTAVGGGLAWGSSLLISQ